MTKVSYGNETYPKQLAKFQQEVNPKPSVEETNRLKQGIIDGRKDRKPLTPNDIRTQVGFDKLEETTDETN